MKRGREKSRRQLRVASLIREIASETIVTELNDPRLGFVTVTRVELSPDMRVAEVYISVIGEPKIGKECLRAVRHARGYIQEKVGDSLAMKFCPVLEFHLDDSVKKSVAISSLIAEARAEDEAARSERIQRGVEPAPENDRGGS